MGEAPLAGPAIPVIPSAEGTAAQASGSAVFTLLDGVAGTDRTHAGTAAGGTRSLEVSLPDAGSGALHVEAHLAGGQVLAAIHVEREPSLHLLARELPAMQQFLAASHVEVKSVSVEIGQGGSGQQPPADQPSAGEKRGASPSSPGHPSPLPEAPPLAASFPESPRLLSVQA